MIGRTQNVQGISKFITGKASKSVSTDASLLPASSFT
jgi:hypothetical protein